MELTLGALAPSYYHVHNTMDETVTVLDGQIEFNVAGTKYLRPAGRSCTFRAACITASPILDHQGACRSFSPLPLTARSIFEACTISSRPPSWMRALAAAEAVRSAADSRRAMISIGNVTIRSPFRLQ